MFLLYVDERSFSLQSPLNIFLIGMRRKGGREWFTLALEKPRLT